MRPSLISRRFSLTSNSHLIVAQYLGIAFAAASIDWLTKFIVVELLGEGGGVPLWKGFWLLVTYNTGSAGGVIVGPFTWHS